jgi:hypothetical protein
VTKPDPARRGDGDSEEAAAFRPQVLYEEGIGAYERGDYVVTRRLLAQVVNSSARKEMRVRAGEILRVLEPDRFALALAVFFALGLAAIFALFVL